VVAGPSRITRDNSESKRPEGHSHEALGHKKAEEFVFVNPKIQKPYTDINKALATAWITPN
jgi:hypothetical protein